MPCKSGYDINSKHGFVMMNGIEIDEKIAPLIGMLWSLGLETQYSCESLSDSCECCGKISNGRTQILFWKLSHAAFFSEMTRARLNDTDDVFQSMLCMEPMPGDKSRWSVRFDPSFIDPITEIWNKIIKE